MWKEWLWTNLRYFPRIFLEGLSNITKTTVRTASCWADLYLGPPEQERILTTWWWLLVVAQCSVTTPWVFYDVQAQLLYSMSEEGRSIFWEVIVLVILSKKVCMYMCLILNSFRYRAISLYSTLYTLNRRATCHVLTWVTKCIHVESGIFKNVL
jgi:hypothetical protein